MVALNFSAATVAPSAAVEPVPSGTYDVNITKSEEVPTKAGNGVMIVFEMTIINNPDPKLNGRKIFDRLNIRNQNQTAVDLAYATLSAICHVTNRIQIADTQQLHGIPFKAVVAKVPRKDLGNGPDGQPLGWSNEIKGYKDANGNDPGKGGAGGSHAPQQGQAPAGWANPQQNGQAPQGYAQQGAQPQPQGYQQAPQQPPQQNGYGGQQPAPQQPQTGPGGAPAWANGGQPGQTSPEHATMAPQAYGGQPAQPPQQQAAPQDGAPPWGAGQQTGAQQAAPAPQQHQAPPPAANSGAPAWAQPQPQG